MTKKLTENQYQLLVSSVDRQETLDSIVSLVENFASVELGSTDKDTLFKIMALANPKTRDTAHDRYIEKEKKYYWNTKKKNEHGHSMNLLHGAGGVVQMMGPKDALTETEIREWGYNPDMFDKELVYND